jgi:hypothetical protein
VRIINDWFGIRRAAMAVMHHALDRHIQPRRQTRDVVSVRFTRSVFNPRQGRGGNSRQIGDVPQAQALLLASTTYGAAQLRCIDSGFLCHGPSLPLNSFSCKTVFYPSNRKWHRLHLWVVHKDHRLKVCATRFGDKKEAGQIPPLNKPRFDSAVKAVARVLGWRSGPDRARAVPPQWLSRFADLPWSAPAPR